MATTIKNKFGEELKKGTGKAILLFKRYNKHIDFRRQLIEAAVHNPDYDPQCSGGRARYLFEMIRRLPDHREIENIILKRFSRTYWCSVEQLFDLAVLFAKNGNDYARQVVYKKFENELESPDGAGAGSFQIVELDGMEGLIAVAKRRGKQLIKDKDEWEAESLLEEAKKLYPKINVLRILKKKAITDSSIRAYLKAVHQNKILCKKRLKKIRKRLSYKKIKRIISAGGKVPMFWGIKATRSDLKAAVNDFAKETDSKRLVQYLRMFWEAKFPLLLEYLLDWKRYKTKELKRLACRALSYYKNEAVRQIGIDYFKKQRMISGAMKLLEKNFAEEDVSLIVNALRREKEPFEFHGAAMSVIDICRDKMTKHSLELLMPVYERGYCSGCRERVIRAMVKNKVLPKQIHKEALLDCNLDTRQYVKRYCPA